MDTLREPLATVQPATAEKLWYKDAIIYQLHVKAFFDSNDDGIGDIAGLTRKLDYLQDLGVTALWLLPFYPSPLRDDGYDIADYRNVNPSYGTMGDFRAFVREAHERGLRIITELVVNHTSDQHPWFQRARRAKRGSRLRDFYVWSDTDKKFAETRIIFLDTEKSNWTWDPIAEAYYWHRFYSHQPDLNFDNPRVFRAVTNAMKFWLDIGVDGMRLDAVPYLIEREGTNNENLPETHDVLKRLRAELDRVYGDRMLLAEANQWPEDVCDYFGEGDECHMAFHFPLMPRIFMAVATEDRHPITDIMRQTPEIPANCQWAVFLRNHDELTLEMVTDRERDYLWTHYASDPRMRINLGIRRRLAPLMENDRRKIELLNSLMFSMPGTPVMYYGDEIGMGDNVFLGDRDGVRTPMQWTPDRNGGFSRSDPARLYLPPVMDPVYGFQSVNVEAQSRSPSSLLNWMKRLIAVRSAYRAFGRGDLKFLYPKNRKIFAYLRRYEDEAILCVANLARSPQAVELDLSEFKGRTPNELLGRSAFPRIGELPYLLTLQGHSFFWFVLTPEDQPEDSSAAANALTEYVTMVLPSGWSDLLDRHNRAQLESDVLPAFLAAQRWFAGKGEKLSRVALEAVAELAGGAESWFLGIVTTQPADDTRERYFLPLGLQWESTADAHVVPQPQKLAEARRFRSNGTLFDAGGEPGFVKAALSAIAGDATIESGARLLRFRRTRAFERVAPSAELEVVRLGGEQSNTSARIGEVAILKIYRHLREGINPEVEMASFLTEQTDFDGTPALLGTIDLVAPSGDVTALGVLVAYLRNQGDAWTQALEYMKQHLEAATLGPSDDGAAQAGSSLASSSDAFFLTMVRQLGLRTAQMHRALCPASGAPPEFAPEPITTEDTDAWRAACHERARHVVALIQRHPATGDEVLARFTANAERLPEAIDALFPSADAIGVMKTRFHGDYHLGQVLVVQNDFSIIDFEGEPLRPLAQRRAKSSPLRDVAGMLRSFDYLTEASLRQMAQLPASLGPTARSAAVRRRDEAIDAFLAGYLETMAGCPSLPADPDAAQRLIRFFALDKALYEIEYELAQRPDWVAIPVAGVLDLMDSAFSKETGARPGRHQANGERSCRLTR